jgi:hypothetical protein
MYICQKTELKSHWTVPLSNFMESGIFSQEVWQPPVYGAVFVYTGQLGGLLYNSQCAGGRGVLAPVFCWSPGSHL